MLQSIWSLSFAQNYTVKDVANGGSITGTVMLGGAPPKPRVITVTKDKEVAKEATRESMWSKSIKERLRKRLSI